MIKKTRAPPTKAGISFGRPANFNTKDDDTSETAKAANLANAESILSTSYHIISERKYLNLFLLLSKPRNLSESILICCSYHPILYVLLGHIPMFSGFFQNSHKLLYLY